jgi:hypothetical protein
MGNIFIICRWMWDFVWHWRILWESYGQHIHLSCEQVYNQTIKQLNLKLFINNNHVCKDCVCISKKCLLEVHFAEGFFSHIFIFCMVNSLTMLLSCTLLFQECRASFAFFLVELKVSIRSIYFHFLHKYFDKTCLCCVTFYLI